MNNENEKSFEELYNESLNESKLDKVVTGKIISITSNGEIFVDIGYKADGLIPKKEYSDDENADPKKEFKIGDEITADVLKMNDGVGNVLLSYKRAKYRDAKKDLELKIENKEIFEEKVVSVSDKGLIVKVADMRIFIPMSLSGISKSEDVNNYVGKTLKFRITEYEPKTNKVIGSVRSVIDEEKEAKLKEFWNDVEIGKIYKGIVSSISSYGAFVDLGQVQGLLHISEITWVRNAKVEDILTQGQEIEVSILDLDKENKRIKLSYTGKGPNPWSLVENKYHVNDIVSVKVKKMMPFGAFVELEPGIEGLVHISQIADKKIAKPEDVLELNQVVNAKIIEIKAEEQRIELSIRELEGTSSEMAEEKVEDEKIEEVKSEVEEGEN